MTNSDPNTPKCACKFHNYTITVLNDGVIEVSHGDKKFHISGNIQTYGLSQITHVFVRGEDGEREIVLCDGNNELILNAEIKFEIIHDI